MNAEDAMHGLHRRLIDGWNAGDAGTMAGALAPDGLLIGFDGSQMFGSGEVATELGRIFADHQTAAYVTMVGRHGDDGCLVALCQTTPARFDGRPALGGALTTELAELLPG